MASPVAAAAVLATWSLGFGLPYLFRPDEDVMVGRSVRMVVEGGLDPLFYNYPPLAFDLFSGAVALARLVPGVHVGAATGVDPSAAILAARAVSALALVAGVAFVGLAGSAIAGRAGGFVAATSLALAPLAVRQAHFATTDGVATALVAAALWAGLRASGRRGFALAGALGGLAAATKYTAGVALVVPLVLAATGRERGERAGRALAATAGAAAAFAVVLLVPGQPLRYAQGLAFLGGRAGLAYGGLPVGLLYHPTTSLPFGLGPGAWALALAGVALGLVRRERADVALLASVLAYAALIGFSREDFHRYVLPVLPALCLFAGGLVRLAPARGPARGLFLAGVLLLQVPSAGASVAGDRLLGAEDTRQQAAAWLLRAAPPGSEVRVDSYWAQPLYDEGELGSRSLHPLYLSGDPVADSFQLGLFTRRLRVNRPGAPCFAVAASGPPWQAPVPPTPRQPLAVFRPTAGPAPAGAVYDPLDAFYLPIWGFDGIERPGPAIAIAPC